MKINSKITKGCKMAAAMLLLSGLTACANPLTGIVEVTLTSLGEEVQDAEGDNIEIRELKLRKIEPDSRAVQEESQEILEEAVPLESMARENGSGTNE